MSGCTRCGAPLVTPMACGSCGAVFPDAAELDHFAQLGLPRRFALDAAELEKRHLALSRGLHPDQHAGRSREERDVAERLTARANEAYATLRDPLRRAEYLLEVQGGPTRMQEKRTPSGFLVEMLEANERIEEAESSLDGAARRRLEEERAALRVRLDALVGEVGRALDSPPVDAPAVREKLNAAAYLQGLVTQITELLLR